MGYPASIVPRSREDPPSDPSAIRLDPETVMNLPDTALNELTILDVNGDGCVSLNEAQGESVTSPNGEIRIAIDEAQDLSRYKALTESLNRQRAFARFASADSPLLSHPFTAETWANDVWDRVMRDGALTTIDDTRALSRIPQLWDVRTANGDAYLLINSQSADDGNGYFFYTLRLPGAIHTGDAISLEMGGMTFDVAEMARSGEMAPFGRARLEDVIALFSAPVPGLPDIDREWGLARAEAIYYQSGVLEESPAETERQNTNFGNRFIKVMENINPQRVEITVTDNSQTAHVLPVLAEEELAAWEIKRLKETWNRIPPELFGILAGNGVLDDLRVEIIEDELLDGYFGAGALAFYNPITRKMHLRRSLLAEEPGMIAKTVLHEMAHAVFAEPCEHHTGGNQSFWRY